MTSVIVTGAVGTRSAAVAEAVASLVDPAAQPSSAALAVASGLILERTGWSITAPPAAPPDPLRPDPVLLAEIGSILAADAAGEPPEAGSDPPGLGLVGPGLLVPWFRRLLGDELVLVVVVDDPRVAAWRAATAMDLEPEQGLAAWMAWHRHLARGAHGLRIVVVDAAATHAPNEPWMPTLEAALAGFGVRTHPATTLPDRSPGVAVEPPLGAIEPSLLGPATDLLAGWCGSRATVHAPSSLRCPEPETWETALLATGRRLEAVRLLQARDAIARAEAEGRARMADAREADLAVAEERIADLEARLVVAKDDLAIAADRQAATDAELAAERARAHELMSLDQARRAELDDAVAREHALALAHLRGSASPIGRLAMRWSAIGTRLPALQAVDRAGNAAVVAATLRPKVLRRHPLFDAEWYVQQYDDVRTAGADPYRHYRKHGVREGRRPNPWLDPDWYRARYPDIASTGVDPMDHYHEHGWREGRDPSADFDTGWYLRAYPDVLVAGIDPLEHYLRRGMAEGRSPRGTEGTRWAIGPGTSIEETQPSRPAASDPEQAGQAVASAPGSWADELTAAVATLPVGAQVLLVADRGDEPPPVVGRTTRWLLPEDGPGRGGRLPATGRDAIVRLEAARWAGADHLVLHREQSWWLDRGPDLAAHLARYRRVPLGKVPVRAWRLTPISRPVEDETDGLVARIRHVTGRGVSMLAWGLPVADLPDRPGVTVFAPLVDEDVLPYLDGTIDIVVLAGDVTGRLAEARRLAAHAVLRQGKRHGPIEPVWLAPSLATSTSVAVALTGDAGRDPDASLIARLADSLLDEPVSDLLVACASAVTPVVPHGSGLPRVRIVPVAADATTAERAAALAASTDADLLAVVDGSAMPVPGWLRPLVAMVDGDSDIDAAVPVLASPDGLVVGGDGLTLGDDRVGAVRPVSDAALGVLVARTADVRALAPGATGSRLELDASSGRVRFAAGGRLEPAAMAIVVATRGGDR
jgi:hypothetical protein